MFQMDVDNRSNFPTERSFHTFKKQRLVFHNVYFIWILEDGTGQLLVGHFNCTH